MESLIELCRHLDRIAAANDDEFRCRVEIESWHTGMVYRFVCQESAEGHEFINSGWWSWRRLENWIEKVDLEVACGQWGYKYVD